MARSNLRLCWYCGALATDRDHTHASSRRVAKRGDKVVPACRDCNTILSDNPTTDPRGRAAIIYRVLLGRRFKTLAEIDHNRERANWARAVALLDL